MAIKGKKDKRNKEREWKKINGKWYKKEASSHKRVKFIPCDEDTQVYNWQRTNKKAVENFNNGPTGAIMKKSRGKVHDYLTREEKSKENSNDDICDLSFLKEIPY
jgi:hypothetical protein